MKRYFILALALAVFPSRLSLHAATPGSHSGCIGTPQPGMGGKSGGSSRPLPKGYSERETIARKALQDALKNKLTSACGGCVSGFALTNAFFSEIIPANSPHPGIVTLEDLKAFLIQELNFCENSMEVNASAFYIFHKYAWPPDGHQVQYVTKGIYTDGAVRWMKDLYPQITDWPPPGSVSFSGVR